MAHQTEAAWVPAAAYEAVWATRAESKADNRSYAINCVSSWARFAGNNPAPVFDPQQVPFQAVPAALAGGYQDLLG